MTVEFVMTVLCAMGGLVGLGILIIQTGLKGDNDNRRQAWIHSGKFSGKFAKNKEDWR